MLRGEFERSVPTPTPSVEIFLVTEATPRTNSEESTHPKAQRKTKEISTKERWSKQRRKEEKRRKKEKRSVNSKKKQWKGKGEKTKEIRREKKSKKKKTVKTGKYFSPDQRPQGREGLPPSEERGSRSGKQNLVPWKTQLEKNWKTKKERKKKKKK